MNHLKLSLMLSWKILKYLKLQWFIYEKTAVTFAGFVFDDPVHLYLVDMKPISSMFPKAVISLTGRVKNAYQFWLPSPPPYYQNLPLLGPPLFSNLEEDSYLIKTSPKYVRSVKVGCGRDVYLGNRVGRVKQRRAWHETLLHFCKTS